jgi:hypothetical protein
LPPLRSVDTLHVNQRLTRRWLDGRTGFRLIDIRHLVDLPITRPLHGKGLRHGRRDPLDRRQTHRKRAPQSALARLQAYDAAITTLEKSLNVNAQRYEDQISLVAAQMPAQMGAGLKAGVAESRQATKPMVEGWIQSQRQAQQKAVELIRFIENVGPNVVLARDPPRLLFLNESDLNSYRTMLEELTAIAAKEEGWREKMLGHQQQMGQKLVRFVENGN